MLRLFEARQVIDAGDAADSFDAPLFGFVERQRVLAGKADELARGELLIEIARQNQRKFGAERKVAADTVSAETIHVDAVSRSNAKAEVVFVFCRIDE